MYMIFKLNNKLLLVILLLLLLINILFANNIFKKKSIINNYFDNVYAIVLEKRKQNVYNVLSSLNIDYQQIDALTPENTPIDTLHCIDKTSKLNNGTKYCHASHVATIKKFLKSGKKNCLILEDDIEYNSEYDTLDLKKTLQSIPKDYDIIYLGYCWDKCKKMKYINKHVMKSYSPHCTHAYGLSRKGAIKLLQHLKPITNLPIDRVFSNLIKNKLLISYSLKIPVFNQNREEFGSYLGNNDCLVLCT